MAPGLPHWAADALPRHLLAALVFVCATTFAFLAHSWDRRVTTAIVYLFGVVAVAGIAGLRGGILAALTASLTYNFFLSNPVFRLGLSTAEDLVPLLAFNVSAIASGLLAG